eukprot:Opistho-2@18612
MGPLRPVRRDIGNEGSDANVVRVEALGEVAILVVEEVTDEPSSMGVSTNAGERAERADAPRDVPSRHEDSVGVEIPKTPVMRRLEDEGRSGSLARVNVRPSKGPIADVGREDRRTTGSAKSGSRRNSAGLHEVRDSQMLNMPKRAIPDTPAAKSMGNNYIPIYRRRGSNLCVFEGIDGFDPKMFSAEDLGASEADAAEQVHIASEDDSDVDYEDCENSDAVVRKWRAKVDRFFERIITPCTPASTSASVPAINVQSQARVASDSKTLSRVA